MGSLSPCISSYLAYTVQRVTDVQRWSSCVTHLAVSNTLYQWLLELLTILYTFKVNFGNLHRRKLIKKVYERCGELRSENVKFKSFLSPNVYVSIWPIWLNFTSSGFPLTPHLISYKLSNESLKCSSLLLDICLFHSNLLRKRKHMHKYKANILLFSKSF